MWECIVLFDAGADTDRLDKKSLPALASRKLAEGVLPLVA